MEEDVIQILCRASNSSTLEKSLESLIEVSRAADGRADLASRRILPIIIQLVQSLPYPSGRQFLILTFRLLRNLCAGEVANQNLFVEQNGVGAILNVFRSARLCSEVDNGITRIGLQVLANVSLAGEEHQREIWRQFFPQEFLALARLRSREVCDPLCMVIYTCCDGNPGLFTEICSGCGLPITREIIRTTAAGEIQYFFFLIPREIVLLFIVLVIFSFGCFTSWIWRRLVEVASFKNMLRTTLLCSNFFRVMPCKS